MTDDTDAQMGAIYDASQGGGEPVIDTSDGGKVHSDSNPRPDSENFVASGEWDSELAAAYDNAENRQRFNDRSEAMPEREGETLEEKAARAFDHSRRLATERGRAEVQFENAGRLALKEKIALAKEFGLDIHGPDGKSVDPLKLGAIDRMLGNGNDGNTAALPAELRQLVPHAKDDAEASRAITEGVGRLSNFDADLPQHGGAAIVQHSHALGYQSIADLSQPGVMARLAAHYHGYSVERLAAEAGMVPVEQVRAYLEQNQQLTEVNAVINSFKKDHPNFDALEEAIMEQIPTVQQRHPNLSHREVLSRAYKAAKRAPRKSKMDRDLDAIADKHFGDEAA